eukprot:superscaffoldBa00009890_g24376
MTPLAEAALALRQTAAIFWDTKKSPVGGGDFPPSKSGAARGLFFRGAGEEEMKRRKDERESVEGRISCWAKGQTEG